MTTPVTLYGKTTCWANCHLDTNVSVLLSCKGVIEDVSVFSPQSNNYVFVC